MSGYYPRDLSNTSNQFLITGCPRSGTQYTARCLQVMGWSISTEAVFGWVDGVVSCVHAPVSFRDVLHQVRDPLKTIGSMATIEDKFFEQHFYPYIGSRGFIDVLDRNLYAWVNWNKFCENKAKMTYRVEEIPEIYPEIFKQIGLPEPSNWTGLVPTNQNTRVGKSKKYREIGSWEELRDYPDYEEGRKLAKHYGYE